MEINERVGARLLFFFCISNFEIYYEEIASLRLEITFVSSKS